MYTAQSSSVPADGQKPRLADLLWLATYSIKGVRRLIRARIIFNGLEAKEIPERNKKLLEKALQDQNSPDASITDIAARIGYVIPRISRRLPWRSDCLIQAIAAQDWLAEHGVSSEIQIGVVKPDDGPFGAHAWLVCEGKVVTGGDIASYEPILAESGDKTELSSKQSL